MASKNAFKKFWVKLKKSTSKRNLNELGGTRTNHSEQSSLHDSASEELSLDANARRQSSAGSVAFNMHHLEKDDFPEFDDVPEEFWDSDSAADEEEKNNDLEHQMLSKKYEIKEDQDVAVFMALADRMSMSSLLHILQGHVRTSNMDIQQYAEIAKKQQSLEKMNGSSNSFAKPRPKKTRFAEVTDRQIREAVQEVECLKSMKGLWWKATEMRSIQEELVETVQYFRRYRHDYIESVEVIAQKSDKLPEEVVEKHLKNLTKDNYTRGLEAHIVRLLSENRKTTVRAVMTAQKLNDAKKGEDDVLKLLRKQSLANSKLSTRFAEKMGQCDEIIALKASLSSW